MALEKFHGSYLIKYLKIGSYTDEIRRTNQGSSLLCKLDDGLFQRMYVCLKACAIGVQHCRPLISLDGCFLNGEYRGQLLATVGVNVNDCIYPIAYVVVEIENTETWTWFIVMKLEAWFMVSYQFKNKIFMSYLILMPIKTL